MGATKKVETEETEVNLAKRGLVGGLEPLVRTSIVRGREV